MVDIFDLIITIYQNNKVHSNKTSFQTECDLRWNAPNRLINISLFYVTKEAFSSICSLFVENRSFIDIRE